MEVYVLVPKKKNILVHVCGLASLITGILSLFFTAIGLFVFLPVAVAGIILGVFLRSRNYEYEYSYFDGDFRFAKIYNKQKRKDLRGYNVEDVIVIAPEGDRSLHNYEKNPQVKTRDLTSGYKNEGKVYCLVAKTEERYEMTKFEPDEKYLDSVCVKYRQKVVR